MTELEALRRVAEAARQSLVRWDRAAATRVLESRLADLAAIDAIPTEAPGEMVEVRAVVLVSADGGNWTVFGADIYDGSDAEMERALRLRCSPDDGELRAATITARVPLPRVPEIVATVEPAP